MATTDAKDAIKEFKDAVNMTPKELERWLETDDSQEMGWKDSKGDESTRHASGRRIALLLGKKQADYTDDDVKHMCKAASYVHRHLAQDQKGHPLVPPADELGLRPA